MTTLLLERSPSRADDFERDARLRQGDTLCSERVNAHSRLTLDDVITSVWEGLAVGAHVSCPVCAGSMTSRSPAGRGDMPTAACLTCGSRLS